MRGERDNSPMIEMSDDEKIDFVAARILAQHKEAFLELAKWPDRETADDENEASSLADTQGASLI